MSEFQLIDHLRLRASSRPDVILGIGDDAALLQVPEGHVLVVTTDTLVAGRHFPQDTAPADVGWKSLAVSLSDLAAMAAKPAWASLALTMPEPDPVWLDAFADGFFELAQQHEVALIGGDTTRGPLSITITALGLVPHGQALRRSGARVGDDIWVTGSLGDAAGGLAQWRSKGARSAKLRYRLDRPTPRIEAALAMRDWAHAAIDISDGLAADLGHLLKASGVGAELDLGRLPTSRTLAEHFPEQAARWLLQLSGGDDYELCFTAATADAFDIEQAMSMLEVQAAVVGRVTASTGLALLSPEGRPFVLVNSGYDHFSTGDR